MAPLFGAFLRSFPRKGTAELVQIPQSRDEATQAEIPRAVGATSGSRQGTAFRSVAEIPRALSALAKGAKSREAVPKNQCAVGATLEGAWVNPTWVSPLQANTDSQSAAERLFPSASATRAASRS